MGCDIHGWLEVKDNGKWVAISELEDRERDYGRFAKLAGVRGEGEREPLGIPPDISDTARFHINKWGIDGHSHSYLKTDEVVEIFEESFYKVFGFDEECVEGYETRLVFWFDN